MYRRVTPNNSSNTGRNLSLLESECAQQSNWNKLTPPSHVTATSGDIISQIVENTEMRATIDLDDSPDATVVGNRDDDIEVTQVLVSHETSTRATLGSKKPPFPGDFTENRNGQVCAEKIQREMFRETNDIMASINTRNDWFEKKVQNEWFGNFGIFQE